MKVLFINSFYKKGSTGKIVASLHDECTKQNIESYICYSDGPRANGNLFKVANCFEIKFNSLKSHMLGNYGFESQLITKRLIKVIDKVKPDIVHVHNIHAHDFNVKKLFDVLSKKKIKTLITLHDCWLFTGYCPYYLYCGCQKWQANCQKCPVYKKYSFICDRSKKNFLKKQQCLTQLKPTIITPSKWLENEVKQSFLKDCEVITINNGVDQSLFKYKKNSFRERHGLQNKKIILGVAFIFDERKGISDFVRLANDLNDDYRIVLVGQISKKIKLPKKIIHISKTQDQSELAELYSMADVLVNPTKEDNFPTTHIEAISCGLPVITYDVGGAGEVVNDITGIKIKPNDYDSLLNAIVNFHKKNFDKNKIIQYSTRYSDKCFLNEYIKLYK